MRDRKCKVGSEGQGSVRGGAGSEGEGSVRGGVGSEGWSWGGSAIAPLLQ